MYDTNEIYHHGVSGMKWGKRNGPPYPLDAQGKADLREQKKLDAKSKEDYKMHKAYNKQRANKAVKRDVALAMVGGGAIGTLAGGPMAGLASMLASGLATTAFSSAVNAGRNAVNNSNYKKMLLDSQEIKSASEKGKDIITKANNQKSAAKKYLEQDKSSEELDSKAMNAAKKAGLDQGDNWKVYRQAMAGDKKAQNVIENWEKTERSSEVVSSYTNDAKKAIERSDYKSAGRAISEIPYDYYVEKTNKLESQGKTFDEAARIVNSGKSEHGISPTEKIAFNAAEKLLSEIKDKKAKEEFLSELSVGMDASQRDDPSIMVYNNNSGKIISYYDANTVHKELKKNGFNGFDENGKVNTDDLDTIYKVKQKGTNDYYLWGEKLNN